MKRYAIILAMLLVVCPALERLLRGLKPVSGPYYRWEDVKANIAGYLR